MTSLISLDEPDSVYKTGRPLALARGILSFITEEAVLGDMDASGKYPILLREREISRAHSLEESSEGFIKYSINPLVELTTFATDKELDGEDNVEQLLKAGYLDLEELRRVLINNKTLEAVYLHSMEKSEVKSMLRHTLLTQLNSPELQVREGFVKMVFTSQLAQDAFEQLHGDFEKVDNKFQLCEKYGWEWSESDTFDRIFKTEPENVYNALSTETEGYLATAPTTRVNAVCYAFEDIDSSIFGTLPVALYRAILIKLRFPTLKLEDLWTTLPTDSKNGVVGLGESDVRKPRPGEIFATNLGAFEVTRLIDAIRNDSVIDLFVEAARRGEVPNNTILAFGRSEGETTRRDAQAELDRIFTGTLPVVQERFRSLHPGRFLDALDSDLDKWSKRTDGITLGKPRGGLVEEPTTKNLVVETRYGKRHLFLSHDGNYYLRSRYKSVLKAMFATRVDLTTFVGSVGVQSMTIGKGQPVPIEWVINTLFTSKGPDAEIHARHAMFLYQSHELQANSHSSSMFQTRADDGKDLYAIFSSKFVREVDCLLETATGDVFMLIGGKLHQIMHANDGNFTLGSEHEITPGGYRRFRRVNVDLGGKYIG